MLDFIFTGAVSHNMENLSDGCRQNCTARNTDDSPEDILLFPGYSMALLQFAAACCLLFMIVGILGNLITIVALLGCKKVSHYLIANSTLLHVFARIHVLIVSCVVVVFLSKSAEEIPLSREFRANKNCENLFNLEATNSRYLAKVNTSGIFTSNKHFVA